ncbi:MAG: malto-oligosyltrehalose synthase, partial [Gemmatimonadota bacterium]
RDAVGYLHDTNIERSTRWPRTMLATNTHDTKRSADVRARIDALSEVPREWAEQLARWERAHRGLKVRVHDRLAPDAHMEYVIYQTLVGVWPVYRSDAGERDALCARVSEFARKAAREAKGRTSWTDPDEEYEGALACFIRSLFDRAEFVRELEAFVESIAASGALNAIARTVLHLTSPGFPDIYQGDELWNYSLVDPDNRREVSYEVRERLLGELEAMSPIGDISQVMNSLDLTVIGEDALKLVIIQRILLARAANAELFAHGDYRPLGAHGSHADHLFAFARRTLGAAAIVVVPRLTHAFAPHTLPVGELWADTTLHLPGSLASTRWRCAISGRERTVAAHASTDPALAPPSTIPVPVSQILAAAPVAVLLTTPASVKKPK